MPVQMAFTGVPNEILACNPFITSVPPAVNQGASTYFPDTMCFLEVRRSTLACDQGTARRVHVILTGPLTRHSRQARVNSLRRD